MRSNGSVGALVATLLTLLVAPAAGADPVAVVAAVKGRVLVTSAHEPRGVRAAFGRALERGDKVSVGAGGSATVFFNDGNVIELAEKSAITIGGRLATGPRAAALPGDVFAQVSRFVTAGSRQTGLVALAQMRSGDDDTAPLLLAPRRTSVLTDAPELSWRPVPGATRYRVRLTGANDAELWSREVPAPAASGEVTLAYPADAPRLAADTDVQWEVQALDDARTLRRESTTMRAASAEARGDVHSNLTRISDGAGGERSAAARFLAGSYLSALGYYQGAAEQFRALATLAPDSPAPHEALGNVYRAVGLMDLAASEFQQALTLQRDTR
jgi:hypothetical protein